MNGFSFESPSYTFVSRNEAYDFDQEYPHENKFRKHNLLISSIVDDDSQAIATASSQATTSLTKNDQESIREAGENLADRLN